MSPWISKPLSAFRRLTSAPQRRFLRSRPGSVLILVIALLVILALLGTAYISTTRIDRYTASQNSTNTQADLLLQGLINATNGAVAADLNGATTTTGSQYRPPTSIALPVVETGYNNYTSPTTDLFLSDRIPGGTAALPTWGSFSWPLFMASAGGYAFDLPNTGAQQVIATVTDLQTPNFKAQRQAVPSSIMVGGQLMPALAIYDAATSSYVSVPFLAADADGDGIADAGLWKLPVGVLNGVTYYAAIRIIDNNSAINVNTAISNASDFATDGSGTIDATGASFTVTSTASAENLGFFPSHVGLMQILADYTASGGTSVEMNNALNYIFANASTTPLTAALSPTLDQAYADGSATARTDFKFSTIGENLASQLARRLGNPGEFSSSKAVYQPFSMNEQATLAYRFCLRNPNASPSELETRMPTSIVSNVATVAYSPQNTAGWFTNFDYTAAGVRTARPLVVTANPVADFIPAHSVTNAASNNGLPEPLNLGMLPYNPPVWSSSASYIAGNFVKYSYKAGTPTQCYEALAASTAQMPADVNGVINTANWREEPWTPTPTKANINTADFPALWRAFCNIMADTGDQIPPAPGTTTPILYTADGWGPFRSSTRAHVVSAATTLTSGEMLQLRSAIAAVNAMDARDSDDDVTSRRFTIYTDKTHTTAAYDVTVYGQERQPFITMVAADFDGTNPTQVSIELYNPGGTDIDMTNWQIGVIDRSVTPMTITYMNRSAPPTGVPSPIPTGTKIAAGGYLILQGSGAVNITPGVNEIAVSMPGLELAAEADPGGSPLPLNPPLEVVLLRPRSADPTAINPLTASAVFDNVYDEGTVAQPNLDRMVPVDMIDFSGVFTKGAAARAVYERPHGPDPAGLNEGYNWKFVYPGAYNGAAVAPAPCQTGWSVLGASATPLFGGIQSDGTTQGGNNKNNFPPIQLAASYNATSNWIAPHTASSNTGNLYPFGGFARNGDMLKVPFIGAYVIRAPGAATGTFVAMNSITMDASQADAGVAADQPDEALGRFCPLAALNPANLAYTTGTNNDPYGWASDFFDYLDVQVANDDYFPNVDPALSDVTTPANPRTQKYPNVAPPPALSAPLAVSNSTGAVNGTGEESFGKQGLININTAPAYVLQQLPGVSPDMAKAIVAYRQSAKGPFKSIFDLNQVGAGTPGGIGEFRSRGGQFKITTAPFLLADDPGVAEGDFTPLTGNDGIRNDFEEQTLMLSRISNLITTRSDTFTCYVLLQGWRGVGTGSPTLAVQRRAAFILDRTNVTPSNSTPLNFNIPSN